MSQRRAVLVSLLACLLLFPASAPGSTKNFLRRAPYVGLICGLGHPKCQKMGIAVWVAGRRPALLAGTVRGRSVRFAAPPANVRVRDYWQAFVPREGVRVGDTITLALTVRYSKGSRASRTVSVRLMPGWG
jgi:hypothetical protein